MNQERPNEERAKEIVERELRLRLDHHDTYGGVDYLSPDGEVALEVTAVTDGEKTGAWKALKKSVAKGAPNSPLMSCWLIIVPDDQADMKTFVQRVQPAIVELELAAGSYFDVRRAAIHAIQGGPLAAVY